MRLTHHRKAANGRNTLSACVAAVSSPTIGLVVMVGILVAWPLGACRKTRSTEEHTKGRTGEPWFEEVAAASNVDFTHVSGHRERFWFPECMTGGACLLDYDNDGNLDIYLVQASDLNAPLSPQPGNQLYRNRGNGTFEEVTADAGVGDAGHGMGCACGDYDSDGDIDLYVTNLGPNVLYRNNGDGTFTDVTSPAGVGDPSWSSSASFVDYDADGNLDLFVVNYVMWSQAREIDCVSPDGTLNYCSPLSYDAPARDTLYRNLGRGAFVNATMATGVLEAYGNGLGIVCADLNNDHRIDVFVANDGMENQFWINQGQGRFVDRALLAGCALNEYGTPEAGMGVAAVDIDHDGDLDLFMSHLRGETNTFYFNRNGLFEDATSATGLAVPSVPYTGFGFGFADFDHDTHLDLYVVNGRVTWRLPLLDPNDPFAEPNQLYRGLPGGRFEEIMPQGGTAEPLIRTSRAAAFGDLDNDGDIDIVVVNRDAKPLVLRNVVGDRGNWIMFRVLLAGNLDALGATLRIDAGGQSQRRLVQPSYGYCTSNDPRVHCGLGPATKVDRVVVRWLDGAVESFGPFAAGRLYELRQGSGR